MCSCDSSVFKYSTYKVKLKAKLKQNKKNEYEARN